MEDGVGNISKLICQTSRDLKAIRNHQKTDKNVVNSQKIINTSLADKLDKVDPPSMAHNLTFPPKNEIKDPTQTGGGTLYWGFAAGVSLRNWRSPVLWELCTTLLAELPLR